MRNPKKCVSTFILVGLIYYQHHFGRWVIRGTEWGQGDILYKQGEI